MINQNKNDKAITIQTKVCLGAFKKRQSKTGNTYYQVIGSCSELGEISFLIASQDALSFQSAVQSTSVGSVHEGTLTFKPSYDLNGNVRHGNYTLFFNFKRSADKAERVTVDPNDLPF